MRARKTLIAAIAAAVLLAGGGVAALVLRSRYEVPTADLFGPQSAAPSLDGSAPSPSPTPSLSPTPEPGAGITGPLNILLAGLDTRESVQDWPPHADAVLLLHVSKNHDRAWLYSLPRDLYLDVPAFAPSRFSGARTKLTHAFTYGSRVPGKAKPDQALGFQLLARTVSAYTGIQRFDAGAVLNFRGMTRLVDAIGGVDLYVDQRVPSIHRRPDGGYRTPGNGVGGYVGPQMVYEKGQRHLNGWQALDFSRQRYSLPAGIYDRQRHQQQVIKAVIRQLFTRDMVTDPIELDRVLRALGDTLTFDGRGRRVVDFAYALKGVLADSVTLVGLPGDSVGQGGSYRGERLEAVAKPFFTAVRADTVDTFLRTHPKLIIG